MRVQLGYPHRYFLEWYCYWITYQVLWILFCCGGVFVDNSNTFLPRETFRSGLCLQYHVMNIQKHSYMLANSRPDCIIHYYNILLQQSVRVQPRKVNFFTPEQSVTETIAFIMEPCELCFASKAVIIQITKAW